MIIVFDIGGTHMRVAASEDGKTIGEPIIHPTPEHFKQGAALLIKTIKSLAKKSSIAGISGCISGVLDRESGVIIHSPNLRGWEDHSLKVALADLCPTIFIENDAAFAGLGEALDGAGRDKEIVAYFTISTGVGGARIVQEMIDIRRINFEPGQQIIDSETLNSLENVISGKALERKYHKHPKDIEDPAVWKKAAAMLAIGIHNTILHWSPDIIVLGGPMILKKPGIDINEVEKSLRSIMIMFPEIPILVEAELGDQAGLIGALRYFGQMTGAQPLY